MHFKQIIFDVDDTLIDFADTENFALHSLFNAHHWELTDEIQRQYHSYNQGLWRELENGTITYQELSEAVFHNFLKNTFNIEVNGLAVMNEYRSYFSRAYKLLPGVKDTLRFAQKQHFELTILTNGETFML